MSDDDEAVAVDAAGELLLLEDRHFPRAAHYCVHEAEQSMHAITGTPGDAVSNPVERRLGRLRSELAYMTTEDIFDLGLHETIDTLQKRLIQIDDAIHALLFSARPADGMQSQSTQS